MDRRRLSSKALVPAFQNQPAAANLNASASATVVASECEGLNLRRFARFKEMKERGYFNDRTAAARAIDRGFPPPFELGPNTLAWDLDEVEAYIAARPRRIPKTGAIRTRAVVEGA